MIGNSLQARGGIRILLSGLMLAALLNATTSAYAENCQTASDMDDATRSILTTSGQRYFEMITRGDTASLRQNAIPSVAGDFSGIETTVKEHLADLAGAHTV